VFQQGGHIQTFPVIVLMHKGEVLIKHGDFDRYVKDLEKEDPNGNQQ
jgi:hypothetical protein